MTAARDLRVSAIAARTACGDSIEQTAAAIRAGIVVLHEDPRYLALPAAGRDPEPARTARAREIDPDLDGQGRLFALLAPVLADLLERAPHLARDARRTALLLALPEKDAVTDTWGLDGLAPELARRLGLPFASVHASRAGNTGVIALLSEAASLFAKGAAEACVVAGVDSLVGVPRMRLLDEAGRLRSPRNLDGLFPGEAASAVVVEPSRRIAARGERALLAILGIGIAGEPETVRSERPSTGRGLSEALRAAIGASAPRWGMSDFNGELYRGYEWGLVMARLGERLGSLASTSFPVRSTGDIGAASGGVLLGLAAAGFRRGWAPSEEALIWAGSDGGERAALRVASVRE